MFLPFAVQNVRPLRSLREAFPGGREKLRKSGAGFYFKEML